MQKDFEIGLDDLDSHIKEFINKFLLEKLDIYFKNNNKAFIIALNGDLGAGKTTWVRALFRSLGVKGNIKSPTFNYVNEYSVDFNDFNKLNNLKNLDINMLYHFDMYRIDDKNSFYELGLAEIFQEDKAICIIEWPEKVKGLISEPNLVINFSDNKDNIFKTDSRYISFDM